MEIKLMKSDRPGKKYKVVITDGRSKTIHFGASGMGDFTVYSKMSPTLANERKKAYIRRHFQREDWTKAGIKTAGFWSKHILWNKPTVEASIRDTATRFGVSINS